jgi:putative PIN family toxin of toxin-antitoxin system
MTGADREPVEAPRAVLDTNVVLSALVFTGGQTSRIRANWQRRAFVPLVATATVRELIRALAYPKFRLSTGARQELLADYLPYTEVVRLPRLQPKVPDCRDPADRPFLLLAAVAKAKALVTGDKELLAIRAEIAFPILTPAAFLQSLESEG